MEAGEKLMAVVVVASEPAPPVSASAGITTELEVGVSDATSVPLPVGEKVTASEQKEPWAKTSLDVQPLLLPVVAA